MKRTVMLLLLIAVLSESLSAQNPYNPIPLWEWDKEEVLDNSIIRVEYTMNFYGVTGKEERCSDRRIVEIGSKVRKDYSITLEAKEKDNYKVSKEGGNPSTRLSTDVYPFELFVYNDGTTRCNHRTLLTGPILQFSEIIPSFDWKIGNETIEVAGYSSRKATVSFGGREWTAWFAEDIPVNGGPYKFCGLPGLITKVVSNDGSYEWTMTGIEQTAVPIYEKQFVFRKCSAKEAKALIKVMYAHPYKFLSNAGVRTLVRDKNGRLIPPGSEQDGISLFYDPIEL